jgi:hypothetical protein
MESKERTLIIGGQARLPKELSVGEVFQVVVELDPTKVEVLDVSFTPCVPVIEKMLRQLMIGMKLETDLNQVLDEIEQRLHHKSKKAVMTAIKDLVREYREYQFRKTQKPGNRLEGYQFE